MTKESKSKGEQVLKVSLKPFLEFNLYSKYPHSIPASLEDWDKSALKQSSFEILKSSGAPLNNWLR